jgi:hypothetical protein
MDEHRLGLKPILRRVWARRGRRPVVAVRPRYEWLWVYGFVRPATGETWWLVLPRVSVAAMTTALAEFARAMGAGAEKRIVLTLDQAGWHTSAKVAVPDGITLVPLPARSPELQPAERLWGLVDEAAANQMWETLGTLQAAVVERCRAVRATMREQVRALTRYHWWPAFA